MIGIFNWSKIPKYRQVQNTINQNTTRKNMATQLQIISALWIMLLKYTANQNSAAIISKQLIRVTFINKPVNIAQSKL